MVGRRFASSVRTRYFASIERRRGRGYAGAMADALTTNPHASGNSCPSGVGCGLAHRITYAIPLGLIAALVCTYLISPAFYLEYVLNEEQREYQVVELITVSSALLGSVLMLIASCRLWRGSGPGGAGVAAWRTGRGAAAIIALLMLATFFFAGEEINWGQTYFAEPTSIAKTGATNLHNTISLPVQSLGSAFLIVMFFGLPIAWAFRRQLGLPEAWAPAIAEGPVIFAMACAFAWKLVKSVYGMFILTGDEKQDLLYLQFIDQINEQKEMLVAVALLLYGLFRLCAVGRSLSGPDAPAHS